MDGQVHHLGAAKEDSKTRVNCIAHVNTRPFLNAEAELCIVRASAAETRDIVGAEATAPPVASSGPMQPQHLTSSGPPRPQHLISSVHPPQHLTSSGNQPRGRASCRHQPQHCLTSTCAAAGELTAVEAGELRAVEASSTAAATSTMMSVHRQSSPAAAATSALRLNWTRGSLPASPSPRGSHGAVRPRRSLDRRATQEAGEAAATSLASSPLMQPPLACDDARSPWRLQPIRLLLRSQRRRLLPRFRLVEMRPWRNYPSSWNSEPSPPIVCRAARCRSRSARIPPAQLQRESRSEASPKSPSCLEQRLCAS